MRRLPNVLTLVFATLLAALAIGQGAGGPVAQISFDRGLAPDIPAGMGVGGNAPLRVVAQEGGQAAVFETGPGLTYDLALGPRGAITFGVQPLAPLDDGRNHRYVSAGRDGEPGALLLWKTAQQDDLRVRIYGPEGKYVEVLHPAAARWRPGVWHFIAASWDEQTLRLAVDGAAAGQATMPKGIAPAATRLTVGAGADGQDPALACLDEIRIYDAPRPPARGGPDHTAFLAGERPDLDLPYSRPPSALALDLLPPARTTFAVVSDLHVPPQGAHGQFQHEERVEELVRQLNDLAPEFVLDAGDINTSFPGRPDFDACFANARRILAELKPPVYHAPGNHDVGNKHQFSAEPFPGWFVSPDNIAAYQAVFGPDHFSVDHGDLHAVLLNNQVFNSLPAEDAAQWEWLVADLARHRGKRTLVVMHNPLFWVDLDDTGTNNYETVNQPRRGQFVELCREYGVAAVYTGHTHHAIANIVGQTWLLTLPSTTFARNFGANYGLPANQVVWDPSRIGFLLARELDDRIVYHTIRTYAPLAPPRELVAGRPAPATRFVPAATGELQGPPIGLMAPPPPGVDRDAWHVDFAIDGVAWPDDLATVDRHAWTSQAHADDDQREFLEVRLAEPAPVRRIELWARPGGGGFPTAATLLVRSGPQADWQELLRWDSAPEAVQRGPLAVELDGRMVAAVRLEITGMPPMYQGRRASVAEVAVVDTAGRDRALLSAGATAEAGTSAGGDKRTVNDNLWQAARDVGAADLFLRPEDCAWPPGVREPGPALNRAVNLGRVADTRLWLPLSPATGDAATLVAHARRMATLGPGVGGLILWPTAEQPSQEIAERLRAIRAAVDVPVGLRPASTEQAVAVAEALPVAALVLIDDTDDAVLEGTRRAAGAAPVWVVLGEPEGADPAARAAALAQRAIALLGRGYRVVAPAAGTRSGVLNETGTLTPTAAVVASLNTVLDGASPLKVEGLPPGVVAFDGPQGRVLAIGNDPGAGASVPLSGNGVRYMIDPLRGALERLEPGLSSITLAPGAAPMLVLSRQ